MSQILPPKSIRDILSKNLAIPNYQRPYKWKAKHVLNLITDVEHEYKKNLPDDSGYRYRIGTVILHDEHGMDNIVDGQQRILTIGLILLTIAPDAIGNFGLFQKQINNKTSLDNLSYNQEQIAKYFKNSDDDYKSKFANYLLDGCEMIVIMASNIAEAFQLFDSQNARGKSLEPADLLKAYHLRSMNNEHEKRMCVKRWEEAIDRKLLYHVLSKIIYRCRRWIQRDYDAYEFSNEVIDEFKGVDMDVFRKNAVVLPYMQRLYVTSQINSFNISEPIANGKRFFDYVDHYVAIFELLFPAIEDFQTNYTGEKLASDNEYQDIVRRNCYYSPKMYRVGDRRLRNALYCLLVAYYDKFGQTAYKDFFKVAYQYVFQLRLELSQIRQESIRDYVLYGLTVGDKSKYANRKNPFEWIVESYQAYPSALRALLRQGRSFSIDDLNSNVIKKNE